MWAPTNVIYISRELDQEPSDQQPTELIQEGK